MRCCYPKCQKQSTKEWAQVPLCANHHEAIKNETIKYYTKKSHSGKSEDKRTEYKKIAYLIPWSQENMDAKKVRI